MTATPFQQALGADFAKLPMALQRFHAAVGRQSYHGRTSVEHGRGVLSAVAIKLGGFPPSTADTSLSITVTPAEGAERWERMFGSHKTTSDLWYDPVTSTLIEHFGMVRCALVLSLENDTLNVTVAHASLFGIRLPKFLSPRSESREWQDDQGRFCFDIAAYLGRGSLLIRYSGWLEPRPCTIS